jgi:pimeloyl-ACP methyl ester carboxylesterase
MTEPEELTITIPGLQLAARGWGPADGPRVLCLHGWLDNAASFDRLLPRLPGLRLVALDLPGHGLSQHKPPGASYPFIDAVADVAAVLDALGWSRASLLGHSLGGALAAMLAGAWPDRVERLALIEGLAPLTEAPELAAERLGRALLEQRDKADRRPPVHASVEAAAHRLGSSFARLSPAAARILCTRGLIEVPGGVTWRSDPRVRWISRTRLHEDQVLALLGAIRAEVMLVRADDGLWSDSPELARRLERLPAATMVRLPGSHHLHLEDPEPVAAALRGFFAPLLARS